MTAGLVVLVACTTSVPDPSPSPTGAFAPTFEEMTCPSDVEVTLLVDHMCGFLTVLQDRASGDGPTARLLVIRIDPPGGPDAPDPMLVAGADIGNEPLIGSFAPLATRVQRTVYILEPRGVGHAEPLLTCPEVDELAVEVAGSPFGDSTVREQFLDAVGACHTRLVANGVALASFGVEEAAADIEDLRRVLDIPIWNLVSYGSNSRFVLESARRFPDGVRAVATDSPEFQRFGTTTGPEAFARAVRALSDACARQPECDSAAPGLEALLVEAVETLDATPIDMEVTDGSAAQRAGGTLAVHVDGGSALRAVRSALGGDGPSNAKRLPAAIALAAAGESAPLFGEILGNDLPLCAGYRPLCPREPDDFSLGVYLSVLCGDASPSMDEESTAPELGGPLYRRLFEDNPYLTACERWDVAPADASVDEAITRERPVLILTGQLDSFSLAAGAEDAAGSLPNAVVIDVPGQTHNVLGFTECTLAIRNAWINDPHTRPDTACLDEMSITFDMTEAP